MNIKTGMQSKSCGETKRRIHEMFLQYFVEQNLRVNMTDTSLRGFWKNPWQTMLRFVL